MYGLEGILGNLVTDVAAPAAGGIMGDLAGQAVEDQLLKELTQTTVGTLSGAALGAGIGYLTGGKSGAISSGITGAIGGGLGGYHSKDIAQMFGMGQPAPQGVGAPQARQVPAQASPMPFTSNAQQQQQDPFLAAISPKQSQAQLNAVRSTMPTGSQPSVVEDYLAPTQQKTPASPATVAQAPSEYKGYLDFLKKNYEPLAGGFYLGSAYGATQDTKEQEKRRKQNEFLAALLENKNALNFARDTWGYASGGPVDVGLANPQIQVHFPAWAQEEIQREGGLAALQPGMKQGMAEGGSIEDQVAPYQSDINSKAEQAISQQEADEGRALSSSEKREVYDAIRTRLLNKAQLGLGYVAPSAGLGAHLSGLQKKATGGYVNTQPFNPQQFYPQSRIASAQPYAAAAPASVIDTLHEGASFAHGGLIDGPGDGMSDSIPANIGGQEPVKVADGEYVIPRSVAAKYTPEKLKHAMTKIRAAAHAKKGKQIVQGAAQRALIQSLTGVRA